MTQFILRDHSGWRANGLPMCSASSTACKMYDSALLQAFGSYINCPWGNISQTINLMLSEDPDFVMGNVLDVNLALLMGDVPASDPGIVRKLDHLKYLKTHKQNLNDWESRHIEAVEYLAKGQLENVTDTWQSILVEYPKDALCARLGYNIMSFQGGKFDELRDMLARSVSAFHHTEPEYGYILGLYGFSLEQTFHYEKAEKVINEALQIYPDAPASTHSMCHVLDATDRYEEGITFLTDRAHLWGKSQSHACHLYWHKALYYIDKGDFKEALDIFDTELAKRSKEKDCLYTARLRDAVTVLYRLKLEGVEIGTERWREVIDICAKHMHNHTVALIDVHIMLGLCGSQQTKLSNQFLESVKAIVRADADTTITRTSKEVNLSLCEAIAAFERKDYEQVVEILLPVKYKIVHIGGSNAQRDLFPQMLVHAAILSPNPVHHKLAKQLLSERREFKNTPLVDRLDAKLLQIHQTE